MASTNFEEKYFETKNDFSSYLKRDKCHERRGILAEFYRRNLLR